MITTCKFLAWWVGGSKYGKRRVDEPLTDLTLEALRLKELREK